MATENSAAVPVRGDVLRRMRKKNFPSAEAFAAACGSVSLPTVYRAERGGPIMLSYLSRIADELGVDVDDLRVARTEGATDLTGEWLGLVLVTDRFGHPSVILEEIHLEQRGNKVEGRTIQQVNEDTMIDLMRDCSFQDNVLCGQSRSETWAFPLETAVFVLSGSRDMTWLDGYVTWFDVDSQLPQSSKYIMIRRDTPKYDVNVKNAHRIMDDEAKLLRTRRFLESGYSFKTSLSLVTAIEDDENAQEETQLPVRPMRGLQETPLIAMAPFKVSSSAKSQEHFAAGLLDEIASNLSSVPGLRVLPRSAFGRQATISTSHAGALGATYLLKGRLDKSNDRVRVRIQLVHLESGEVVWGERYDHGSEVLFAMHDVIARDLARSLLDQKDQMPAPSTDTGNAIAYELFVKARALYSRGMYSPTLRAAEALLKRAVTLEPTFARAYAQLSICRSYLAQSIERTDGAHAAKAGFEDAERALELSPDLPLGHAALGLALYATGDYSGAAIWLERAIEMDDTLFEPHFFQARNKRLLGDRAGAIDSFAKAVTLRMDDFRAVGLMAEELLALGYKDKAREAQQNALRLIESELELHPDNAGAMAFGAGLLAELGKSEQGLTWAEWAIAIAPNDCLVQYNVARFHALKGNASKAALDHLELAFSVPQIVKKRLAMWMKFDEAFKRLRNNQRYERLQAHIGSVD